jgi:hypothetical protein
MTMDRKNDGHKCGPSRRRRRRRRSEDTQEDRERRKKKNMAMALHDCCANDYSTVYRAG